MPDSNGGSKAKKTNTFVVRDVPPAEWDALERMYLKVGMTREGFGRMFLRLAIWGAPGLFERAMREAVGEEPAAEALPDNPKS